MNYWEWWEQKERQRGEGKGEGRKWRSRRGTGKTKRVKTQRTERHMVYSNLYDYVFSPHPHPPCRGISKYISCDNFLIQKKKKKI